MLKKNLLTFSHIFFFWILPKKKKKTLTHMSLRAYDVYFTHIASTLINYNNKLPDNLTFIFINFNVQFITVSIMETSKIPLIIKPRNY